MREKQIMKLRIYLDDRHTLYTWIKLYISQLSYNLKVFIIPAICPCSNPSSLLSVSLSSSCFFANLAAKSSALSPIYTAILSACPGAILTSTKMSGRRSFWKLYGFDYMSTMPSLRGKFVFFSIYRSFLRLCVLLKSGLLSCKAKREAFLLKS